MPTFFHCQESINNEASALVHKYIPLLISLHRRFSPVSLKLKERGSAVSLFFVHFVLSVYTICSLPTDEKEK